MFLLHVAGGAAAVGASASPYAISYSYVGDTNDAPANDSSITLTVNKATPTITWSDPAGIVYGASLVSPT